jgi:hypothetical protein
MGTRRSREQWAGVVEEWAASGEIAEAFCQRRGIRRSTLSWWKWKLASSARSPSPSAAIRLLRVAVSPEGGGPRMARGIAVDVGDVRVHVETGTDVAYVGELIDRLRRRC